MDILSILIAFAITALAIIIIQQFWFPSEFTRKIDKIPGSKPFPFFGNMLQLAKVSHKDLVQYQYERFKLYGPVNKTWLLFGKSVVHLQSPESVETLISGTKHLAKSDFYDLLHPWLGQGLLTSKGAKWFKHRKMITPTFHFTILETFMDVMVDKSNILVKVLNKHAGTGKQFNVFTYITNVTLDIICETAMGTNINAQDVAENEYITAIYTLSESVMHRIIKPWLYFDIIFYNTPAGKVYTKSLKTLHGFTESIIKERKETRKSRKKKAAVVNDEDILLGGKKRVAFLDLLLDVADKDPTLTEVDIREEVDTFMFEGHDTTTAGLLWTIYLLGRHSEIQEKAYNEIKDILNGEDRSINLQDVNEMKYLERVIKDSLRLYPPVPAFSREVEEDINVHGYTIPAGAYANVEAYILHRNPAYFPNPEQFNPDNFLSEVARERHPYAYVPFSAGPRNCIGQKFAMIEEKTVLATILKKFKIESVDKPEDVPLVAELILRPLNGINIKLEKR